ncbi:MAG TPA: PH domain-containing protein [Thermoanaerobaculia bacterium]|nr:PH domain-containing protein [Thermoanaerobaculia bacterium]
MTSEQRVFAIRRPHPSLWKYYILTSLLLGPLFFIPLIPLYFRYHTMQYEFDEEGIAMRWGILFRREVTLTYARIQDIHLVSNFVERWLGLARVQIQTASGSSNAEMTIEGVREFAMVRDFLYSKMRGIREAGGPAAKKTGSNTLEAVADEMRRIRELLGRILQEKR